MNKTLLSFIMAAGVAVALPALTDEVRIDRAVELVEQGTIKHPRDVTRTVLELHPGATIEDVELEREQGRYVYEYDVRDSAGVQWDVYIDASDGTVLKNQRDD